MDLFRRLPQIVVYKSVFGMFYKIRIVADVLECDAYRFVLFHIFPFMNNVYFHRKDNKVFLLFVFFYEMSYY